MCINSTKAYQKENIVLIAAFLLIFSGIILLIITESQDTYTMNIIQGFHSENRHIEITLQVKPSTCDLSTQYKKNRAEISSLLLGKTCLIVPNLSWQHSDLNWEAGQHPFMMMSCDRRMLILVVDASEGMASPSKLY